MASLKVIYKIALHILALFGVLFFFHINIIGEGYVPKEKFINVDMGNILTALKISYKDKGRYPSINEGLECLASEVKNCQRIISELPKNHLNRDYGYMLVEHEGSVMPIIWSDIVGNQELNLKYCAWA